MILFDLSVEVYIRIAPHGYGRYKCKPRHCLDVVPRCAPKTDLPNIFWDSCRTARHGTGRGPGSRGPCGWRLCRGPMVLGPLVCVSRLRGGSILCLAASLALGPARLDRDYCAGVCGRQSLFGFDARRFYNRCLSAGAVALLRVHGALATLALAGASRWRVQARPPSQCM